MCGSHEPTLVDEMSESILCIREERLDDGLMQARILAS